MIEALKKKSRRGFLTIPILSMPTFCAPFNRIYSLDDFNPFLLVTHSGSAFSLLLGK
jgi:hypothetical protein